MGKVLTLLTIIVKLFVFYVALTVLANESRAGEHIIAIIIIPLLFVNIILNLKELENCNER